MKAHTATVNDFIFDKDYRVLYSVSDDQSIICWNIDNVKENYM